MIVSSRRIAKCHLVMLPIHFIRIGGAITAHTPCAQRKVITLCLLSELYHTINNTWVCILSFSSVKCME